MSGLVTLTTDFGLTDEYVGIMKGVILSLAPTTQIVDLSHEIEPQNIAQAAYLINSSRQYFPDNTIHILVVDPGVGSNRRMILVGARRQLFLAPDNGVLSLVFDDNELDFAHAITNEELYLHPVSQTFHGRDILAPVAAHLAKGLAVETVGPPLDSKELKQLNLAASISTDGKSIIGRVIQIDRFGNLITNIHRHDLQKLTASSTGSTLTVTVGTSTINNLVAYYAEATPGELLALFGSRDYLEIAINKGNAGKYLGINTGKIVELKNDKKVTLHATL
ncbi:MAG: SAM-dependent chlorinase/fluorinase [Desulfobulbaceae bacterium]|nr:SAM-dependent chlorinase/fluorinase [Desulfobulbaceae bacterium]